MTDDDSESVLSESHEGSEQELPVIQLCGLVEELRYRGGAWGPPLLLLRPPPRAASYLGTSMENIQALTGETLPLHLCVSNTWANKPFMELEWGGGKRGYLNSALKTETEMFEKYYIKLEPRDHQLPRSSEIKMSAADYAQFRGRHRTKSRTGVDHGVGLTVDQKLELVQKELEDTKDDLQHMRANAERDLQHHEVHLPPGSAMPRLPISALDMFLRLRRNTVFWDTKEAWELRFLRGHILEEFWKRSSLFEIIEEAEIRWNEVEKAVHEFEKDILKSISKKKGSILATQKVMKYIEDMNRRRDNMKEKLRLKNVSLKVQRNKMVLQLRQKEEVGEALHEVDFQQLKIENAQFLETIEARNQELTQLKLSSGNTLQVLSAYKDGSKRTVQIACSTRDEQHRPQWAE
ncbi:hypothetical protein P7K49_036457 [Saguinus oedipus]|uniref:Cilia- and flagella-associated protein 263 n=1 Tax=Saguinus oedipus TaxID=9490 RepID=A0ABQ9TK64_SAGOE|nr:hypothetical protein P7K49_036457 [Saguinus oedipus]